MEKLKAKLSAIPRVTLVAEGSMRAQVHHGTDEPEQIPIPDEQDDLDFSPDMTVWDELTSGETE